MSRPKPVMALAAAFALPVGLSVWSVPAADAQTGTPKFEVATVKLRKSGTPYHFYDCSGDRFMFSGPALGNLLQWTYNTRGDAYHQLIRSVSVPFEFYEIQAKAPSPIESVSQCRLMVQALLADRFKMKVHWEETEGEVFDLVVARGGPKMQPALPTDGGTDVSIVVDGASPAIPATPGGGKGMTMEELTEFLPAEGPVADKTGLEGRYKIDLHYSRRLSAAVTDSSLDPPFDAALAKLGLRLEKHKGAVKVAILDHIEAPDQN